MIDFDERRAIALLQVEKFTASEACEVVVLRSTVNPAGLAGGVDTRCPGVLAVGSRDINTGNDPGGAITTDAAITAASRSTTIRR